MQHRKTYSECVDAVRFWLTEALDLEQLERMAVVLSGTLELPYGLALSLEQNSGGWFPILVNHCSFQKRSLFFFGGSDGFLEKESLEGMELEVSPRKTNSTCGRSLR